MISIQKKFLFIHVPKTAGNSIQNILRYYSEDEIITPGDHQDGVERFEVRNKKYTLTKHSTLSQYKSVLEPNIYHSLFKFATIRNPWDMMISYYFSPNLGITEWNRNIFLKLINNIPTLRHYISVNRSLNNRSLDEDIDFLIRFERLNDDFQAVCNKLGIPHSTLPKRNSSQRSHYSQYYDEELKEIVRSKFSEEINFGNYTFEIT